MVDFNGKAHIGVGLMIALMIGVQSPIAGVGIIVGSLLPDCDIKGSPASIIPLWLFMKHRTYTHSLFACVAVSLMACIVSINFAGGVFLGYILHLVVDSCTPMKTKYFWWPYKKL